MPHDRGRWLYRQPARVGIPPVPAGREGPPTFAALTPGRRPTSKGDPGDVQSHRVKRVVSGTLAASAVFAAVGFVPSSATAAPTPALQQPQSASDALQKYRDLSHKAEQLHQAYLRAKEDLTATQKKLDKANAELKAAKETLARAKQEKERFRDKVDKLAGASFVSGAQFSEIAILLSGDSAQDFLQRSAALNVLATQKKEVLDRLSGAVAKSEAAKQRAAKASSDAQAAKDKAVQLLADIEARKQKLDEQIQKVKQAAGLLSASDQQSLQDTGGSVPNVDAPGAAAQTAVNAALNQRGTPYVWGGESPGGFDCSGLVQWSYAQAGISLPRTAASQAAVGTPVSRSQLKPGDLVYFYSPVSHIGIYIGGGKMVHAPTSGSVVKVSSIDNMSSYSGATRVT